MRVSKKCIFLGLGILLIFLLLILSQYFGKFDIQTVTTKLETLRSDLTQEGGQTTTFSEKLDPSYVIDSDFGAVPGTNSKNSVADRMYSVSRTPVGVSVDASMAFDRILVRSINEDNLEGEILGSGEIKTIKLKCSDESTALFKSFNIEFISAGFDVLDVLSEGDMLYTDCTTDVCDEVGPACVIVRRPSR